ncbi:hypothetical protein J6590_105657, partial [Homalodisca vitripennis]
MLKTRSDLERFEDVQTVHGTRSFHNFNLIESSGNLKARRISSDEKPALTFNLRNKSTSF